MSPHNLVVPSQGTKLEPARAARPPVAGPPDAAALSRSLRRPVLIGMSVITLFLGGFLVWGGTAPLAGGAVASGVISPDGSRKKVQHLEGGIIGDILVKDGDVVQAGAPLVVLEDTQARANHDMLMGQRQSFQATLARLRAEEAGRARVEFPRDLGEAAAQSVDVADIITSQETLFQTRNELHSAKKKVLRQRIDQLGEQINGMNSQLESAIQQLAIINDELIGKEQLLKKELLPRPEYLAVKRKEAEILGNKGEYLASIARAKQQIGETELQLVQADAERADQIAQDQDKTRADLAQIEEKLFASADILKRTVVPAPVTGTIVNLAFKTKGGVVRPGEPILEIVPQNDDLLIDARVAPNDIDIVHPGLPAMVRLSAFASRRMPRIDGIVRSVSADRILDERTGQPYFLARVQVDRDKLKRDIGPDIELVPGMPAEVLIVTGERTMIQYLIKPMRDAFSKAMREA